MSYVAGLVLVAVMILRLIVVGRVWRRWLTAERPPEVRCHACGYDLRGQHRPRCPECGALYGFRVPLDSLGVSEHELRAAHEARQRRRQERPHDLSPGGGDP